jgi:hypothetical protein
MAKLIVPRHTADLDYIIPALEVYYEASDWLETASYKDRLVAKLLKSQKESVRNNDETHYTKCSEIPRYFGLLERKEPGKAKSDVRITDSGKNFYEAFVAQDHDTMHGIIVDALEKVVFGRNNEGCGSDTDCEAPNVVVISALLLDGISNKEAAYILGECVAGEELANTILKVRYFRIGNEKIPSSSVTSDIKFIPFLRRLEFFSENADGYITVNTTVVEKYKDRLCNLAITNSDTTNEGFEIEDSPTPNNNIFDIDIYSSYLAALRTKPFMLLAGISGTGKSRIVREFAFKSCPPALQDEEGTTPGNYCMIEVKPNWHDSTEILGYYSNISKKYHFTKFVKFLVKAMMFPDVPFFVCLDEMNLAPVEQYFAEFLSVLETRKKDKEKKVIQSGVLVAPEYFVPILNADSGNGYIAKYLCPEINVNIPHDIYTNKSLTTIGLTLPDNVFIIGTVNMDDTTHQFSRKVIDRAMTIEMNGGKLEDMFGHSADLQYLPEDQIMELSDFKPEYVNADEVMEAHSEYAETLQEKLVEKLDAINNCLKNTPFQVSYRVLNELCIYAGVLLDDGEDIDNAISKAVNQITLMKILPRIEGDEDMFVTKDGNKLEQLQEILGKDSASGVKLEEMKERLKNSSFTRFWP